MMVGALVMVQMLLVGLLQLESRCPGIAAAALVAHLR
jgi:hypothetical protein